MMTFGLVFLAALALATSVRLWLAWRHITHVRLHRAAVPAEFAGEITLAAHQRAADYTCAKARLAMAGVTAEAAIVLWLTFGGGLQAMHEITASWLPGGIGRGLALIVLVTALMTAAELPFGLYRTFRIEERFGFNRMTLPMFFIDLAKSVLLAAAFGIPLVVCILWLMSKTETYWWFYAWFVWVGFNLFMLAIYPTWIAPLFNKFSPMQDAELKERVERLLTRCGFRVKGLMVMDGSRRSSHGNAYFTGFGKSKRIVFFDTLLSRLNPAEVEAVLAHELGHFKLRHVAKRMTWIFAVSLGFLWLLGYLMEKEWFFHGLNVSAPSTAMALILFFIVVPNFTFLLQPLGAMYSRMHEFEADRYAAQNASAKDLVSALVKLYRDNASTLTPDPAHSAFYDSHPLALIRIARLQKA
ncbi:MAG: peptidase M48 [Betaproteobacteria bacterium RIFCSPLOWO2_12_FULL_62_13]|nr:MAG: peptidase M48 [Betaproteobacteria bacterium RIFCSPLOWO2_12_FULL_62_13]